MHPRSLAIALGISLFTVGGGLAAQTDRNVPLNYPTIQAAILAAAPGDTVRVAPGTYYERINFLGKNIVVRSTQGAAVTTIDGQQAGTVVKMVSGELQAAVLDGFTIKNGLGASAPTWNLITPQPTVDAEAGGITMVGSSGTVIRCIIEQNTGGFAWFNSTGNAGAGGVSLSRSARLIDSIIRNNTGGDGEDAPPPPFYFSLAGRRGGAGGVQTGVETWQPWIIGCTIENNQGGDAGSSLLIGPTVRYNSGGPGGARLASSVQDVVVVQNTRFIGNTGGAGGSASSVYSADGPGGLWISRGYCFGLVVAQNHGGTMYPDSVYGTHPVGGVAAADATLDHCTIAFNQPGTVLDGTPGAGGLYMGDTSTFTNGIIWGNVNSQGQPSSIGISSSGAHLRTNSIVEGGTTGTNILVTNPQFTNAAIGDYTLTAASPAIDAQALPVSPFDLTAHDPNGGPRWLGTAPDWGAFEYGTYDAAKLGTNEDFALFVRRVGTGSPTSLDKSIVAGLTLGVIPLSQGGTMASRYPILLADVFPEGLPPVPLSAAFPMIHVSAECIIAYDGPALGHTMNPAPFITFLIPPGLTGLVVRLQAAIYEPRAKNGFFAMTDAMDVHIE